MRHRHLAASLVVPLVALAVSFGVAAPARAAPQQPARSAVPTVASAILTNKVTLPETSIYGPGLASANTTSVLAWTGTDAAHHLNVETSTDGLHYGHKLTLDETSPFRPDVALATQDGPVAVAWTGTDAHHSLNVLQLFFTNGGLVAGQKFVLSQDSSDAGPS